MNNVNPEIPETAVSVYGQDNGLDDFPVLKAFQQYVDAEQSKARKRMLMLSIFFGCMMFVVIGVFVVLLVTISARNQALNDRLIEFAMKERSNASAASPVVVQPPQDNSAILAMTAKIDALQKKLAEDQAKAEKERQAAAEEARKAAIEAAKPKPPSPAELEVQRLRALLAAEKERQADEKKKQAAEKERQRQAELEAYRRKHYPELYEQPAPRRARKHPVRTTDDELDDIINEDTAIRYYDDETDDEDEKPVRRTKRKQAVKPAQKPTAKPVEKPVEKPAEKPVEKPVEKPAEKPAEENYSIPVDIKGSSSSWQIPEE